MQARFGAGAQAWADYNREPLGRIRREVTWHNLVQYLPAITDPEQPPCVLDAGGGSGELALQLVRRGYRVWLLDYAPAMLEQAREAAKTLPDELRARLNFCHAGVEASADLFAPSSFDVITCHTLLEYLSEPYTALRTLSGLLCEGGLLSVSFVNRHAGVLRQVWSKDDPAGALEGLEDSEFSASLFGIAGTAFAAEEISASLTDLGFTVAATCGVRVFADYVPHEHLEDPEYFDALLRLEKAVASRPPYMLLARYVHLLVRKRFESF